MIVGSRKRLGTKKEEGKMDAFKYITPKYVNRNGGYTRIIKTRTRVGDAAPMAIIELV